MAKFEHEPPYVDHRVPVTVPQCRIDNWATNRGEDIASRLSLPPLSARGGNISRSGLAVKISTAVVFD